MKSNLSSSVLGSKGKKSLLKTMSFASNDNLGESDGGEGGAGTSNSNVNSGV